MRDVSTYHIVSNDVGVILAVYGSSLLSIAKEFSDKVRQESGCPTYINTMFSSIRPHVGQTIDKSSVVGYYIG
jgi:hypothetical protein